MNQPAASSAIPVPKIVKTGQTRDVALANLRTFLILLVVAHHAVLAYHPYAPPLPSSLNTELMYWTAFPIVDSQRLPGSDLLVGFNETFFMSLLFLLSGVFTWPSLVRKGAGEYMRDRVIRLGIPFLVSVVLLAPLAYYPTFLTISRTHPAGSFLRVWLSLKHWPAGPAWFIWVLLVFGGLAAAAYRAASGWGERLGRITGRLSQHPSVYWVVLIVFSASAYLPMAAAFGPGRWVGFGPFWIQVSRSLHYLVYFTAGIGLGVYGIGNGLLARNSLLARRWLLWTAAALVSFAAAVAVVLVTITKQTSGLATPALLTLGNLLYVLTCGCSCLACLAVFIRFARQPGRWFQSLSANAYGIYLLHYFCVSWLQMALLPSHVPALAKAVLVFICAVLLSWSLSAALRKIPAVARVI